MNKNALEMINNIDDEMILSAMETPKAKEKILSFKKLRWTAVAACVALLMAVPAVAQAIGLTLEFNPEANAWNAETDGRFAENEYSKEVREITGQKMFIHESLDEAEKFIGKTAPSQDEFRSDAAKKGERISPQWMPDDIGTKGFYENFYHQENF